MNRAMLQFLFFLACLTIPSLAQISPDEHAKHHPNLPGAVPASTGKGKAGVHLRQPKAELYPSLMSTDTLSPDDRIRWQRAAHERMKEGAAVMQSGMSALSAAAAKDDYQDMDTAVQQVRAGLDTFNSGLATHRALAEGKSPSDAALVWLKPTMGLPQGQSTDTQAVSERKFHLITIGILSAFAAMMIWMYFFKMRRAATLLKKLTQQQASSSSGVSAGGTSPGVAAMRKE